MKKISIYQKKSNKHNHTQTKFLKSTMSFNKIIVATAVFSLFTFVAPAQEKELGTEVIEIIKPYSPSISDAFKIKEMPPAADTVSLKKKKVDYTINSVPVASTFTPEKGKAANVERAKKEKTYDNYARLGLGNYTTLLGELYSNFAISNEENVGFFFRHNSSQGKIKGVELDDKYYDTRLDANYANNQRSFSYGFGLGLEHQMYNWYGVPNDFYTGEQLAEINPAHSFFGGAIKGNIAFENAYLDRANLKLRYLGDSFSSSEFQATLKPEFSFPLDNIDIRLDGDFDYISGSFSNDFAETGEAINYSTLIAGVAPVVSFTQNDLSISLGAAVYLGMNSEANESDFSFYPRVNVSYRLDEAVIVYAGADGGLKQNSYYNFKEENPFISPTLIIAPTKNLYDGFGGIKGTFQNRFGYNFKVSYGKDENRPLFRSNSQIYNSAKGYHYNNSFDVVYDDVTTLAVFGELQVNFSEQFSLGVNATYFNYETESSLPAWNLPNLKASVFSNFNITEQLYGGATLFYTGERKDFVMSMAGEEEVKLDGYVDANIHLGYRVNERLSFFARGNNLFNDNYKKWLNYPVQGIQGMLGATYKFDWK